MCRSSCIIVRCQPAGGEESKLGESAEVEKVAEKAADSILDLARPWLQNLGFSGAMGLATAAAVKAVSVAVAALIGIIFLAVQYLASKGVLDIKWNKVEELAVEVLDLNKDGKLDADDAGVVLKRVISLGAVGLPSVGGYIAGLYTGFNVF